MTAAGKQRELARYQLPEGTRAVVAQRIDGRVAISDVPVDHASASAHWRSRLPEPSSESLLEPLVVFAVHDTRADDPVLAEVHSLPERRWPLIGWGRFEPFCDQAGFLLGVARDRQFGFEARARVAAPSRLR